MSDFYLKQLYKKLHLKIERHNSQPTSPGLVKHLDPPALYIKKTRPTTFRPWLQKQKLLGDLYLQNNSSHHSHHYNADTNYVIQDHHLQGSFLAALILPTLRMWPSSPTGFQPFLNIVPSLFTLQPLPLLFLPEIHSSVPPLIKVTYHLAWLQ